MGIPYTTMTRIGMPHCHVPIRILFRFTQERRVFLCLRLYAFPPFTLPSSRSLFLVTLLLPTHLTSDNLATFLPFTISGAVECNPIKTILLLPKPLCAFRGGDH